MTILEDGANTPSPTGGPTSKYDPEEDTDLEQTEFVGEFPSLPDYFRSQLEELVNGSVHWLFDCVDWRRVQDVMEAGRFRYLLEGHGVYRVGIPTPLDPHGTGPRPGGE